jgi:hypothetical protein
MLNEMVREIAQSRHDGYDPLGTEPPLPAKIEKETTKLKALFPLLFRPTLTVSQ